MTATDGTRANEPERLRRSGSSNKLQPWVPPAMSRSLVADKALHSAGDAVDSPGQLNRAGLAAWRAEPVDRQQR